MLSRVANNLYWLSRYLERAENLARLVDVNRYDALDITGAAEDTELLWRPLLRTTCSEDAFREAKAASHGGSLDVSWFITFHAGEADSILQCIAHARENARMVRDQISEVMWLELNSFHLYVQSQQAQEDWQAQPEEFYRRTIKFCMLFDGLISTTILRDEGWQFIQVGKYLERADKTTRILDMLDYQSNPDRTKLASALRSCSGLSAYRVEFREITPDNVVNFLLFSQSFPRSVRFCVRELDNQLHAISGSPRDTFTNEAEKQAGSSLAKLNFSSLDNVRTMGLHDYMDELQKEFNAIGQQIFETYVLLPSEISSVAGQGDRMWQFQQQQQ